MAQKNATAEVSGQQKAVAETGVKAMIPFERPFLDYSLARVADAGLRQVCLVTGPKHDVLRDYYSSLVCERLTLEFATQQEPLGTAHAIASAEDFVGDDDFIVLNGDNLYPTNVLNQLCQVRGSGLVGFNREGLVHQGNIAAERVAGYALIEADASNQLQSIHEKPSPEYMSSLTEPILVSMNCWQFTPSIFAASRAIEPSSRGEYEIPDAVRYSIEHLNEPFAVLPANEPVLDLSSQEDIAAVARLLEGVEVRL